jgi:hypothetical protein
MGSSSDPANTSVHDHASHPEAGSGLRETKSFDPKVGRERDRQMEGAVGGGGDGSDPAGASSLDASLDDSLGLQGAEKRSDGQKTARADKPGGEAELHGPEDAEIAADDAGVSARIETPQRRSQGMENDG